MPQRAYAIRTAVDGFQKPITYFAQSASKAKYRAFLNARDAGYRIGFPDIRAKSLGMIETPQEIAVRKRDAFNAAYPPGTPVRVYPGAADDERCAYDTVVIAPGAYIPGGLFGTRVSVKVKGDSIAITHVILTTGAATPKPQVGISTMDWARNQNSSGASA